MRYSVNQEDVSDESVCVTANEYHAFHAISLNDVVLYMCLNMLYKRFQLKSTDATQLGKLLLQQTALPVCLTTRPNKS